MKQVLLLCRETRAPVCLIDPSTGVLYHPCLGRCVRKKGLYTTETSNQSLSEFH